MSKRRNKRSPGGAGGRDGSRAERRVRDEQAVSRVRLGDESAWRGLVESWLDFAFDRVTRRGVNARDAAGVLINAFGQVRDQLDDGADTSFAARVAQATSGTGNSTIGAITPTPPSDPKRAAGRITRGTDATALASDPDVAALLWETAVVLGAPTAEVLDLHWRGGLDATEIAAATGADVGAVEDRLAKLPTGYAAALRTRLLWLGGTPAHDQLAEELRAEGATSFDPTASRLIHRHIRACATCRGRSLVALPAVELFGTIPLSPAPGDVREQVLGAVTAPAPPATTTGEDASPATEALTGAALAGAALAGETLEIPGAAAETSQDAASETPREPEPPATTELEPSMTSEPALAATAAAAPDGGAGAGGASRDGSSGPVHTPVASRRAGTLESGRTKRWVGIGIAAAILLVAVIALASRSGDQDTSLDTAAVAEDSTTTTKRSTTTFVTSSTVPITTTTAPTAETTTTTLPTTTTAGGGFFPPPPPPETTTTTVMRVNIASLNLNPKKVASGECATLTWEVSATGPVTVSVSGPGVSSSLLGGSAQACSAGVYSLTVTGNGVVLASRTQELTVKP